MKRMLLPFSMGKPKGVINPFTFEQDIDHPILDIGSSGSCIKPHIQRWLMEQYGTGLCYFGFDGNEYYLDFPTEEDQLVFTLRWL